MNEVVIATTELTPDLETQWTDFVSRHPAGLLYFGLKFRDFLIDVTGGRPRYRVALQGGRVVGVLPVMERDGPYGRVMNALPFFGSHGAPLAATPAAKRALLADWAAMVSEEGLAAGTLIANPLEPDEQPEGLMIDAVDHRSGQFTPLPAGDAAEAKILAMIDGAARRNVARARSAGIVVAEESGALAFLEAVHRENMAAIGGTAKPPRYFTSIPERFAYGEDWRLFVARKDGEAVAAVLMLYANGVAEYFTPAITDEGRATQATALILVEAMAEAARRGLRAWNWGGTWPDQDGVFRFKRKWGAQTKPYRYFVTLREKGLLSATPAELSAAYPFFYVLPFGLLAATRDGR